MILVYSTAFFLLCVFVISKVERRNSKIETWLEEIIASEVRDREIEISPPRNVRQNVLIKSNGRIYRVGSRGFLPVIAAGDSMRFVNIHKGDLVLFNTQMEPQSLVKGDIIAIRMPTDATYNAGKLKLRLFSMIEIQADGSKKIVVDKFSDDGEIVASKGAHDFDALVGIVATSFDKDFGQEFIQNYAM